MITKYYIAALLYCLASAALLACSSGDVPKAPGITAEQAGLDTRTRQEPDKSWDGGLVASDISWRFISFTALRRSISLVGSFKITFINTNFDRELDGNMRLVLRGADGAEHLPETPVGFVRLAIDDTTVVRENFVVELKDVETANDITQLDIAIF